eukprot:m.364591 g.364591  ORF g.364591 m.364591 type:complete len:80 (+) comp27725_c0_seq1:2466-2705(+)
MAGPDQGEGKHPRSVSRQFPFSFLRSLWDSMVVHNTLLTQQVTINHCNNAVFLSMHTKLGGDVMRIGTDSDQQEHLWRI